jgi:hypothetical protein
MVLNDAAARGSAPRSGGGTVAERLGQGRRLGRIATHDLDSVAALDGQGADGAGHVPRADDGYLAHGVLSSAMFRFVDILGGAVPPDPATLPDAVYLLLSARLTDQALVAPLDQHLCAIGRRVDFRTYPASATTASPPPPNATSSPRSTLASRAHRPRPIAEDRSRRGRCRFAF